MTHFTVPPRIQPFLWSYDVAQLNTLRDKNLIIKQVLDYGSSEATDWLRATYTAKDIATVIQNTPVRAWGKKSLALWSLVYNVKPIHKRRALCSTLTGGKGAPWPWVKDASSAEVYPSVLFSGPQ